MNKREYKTKEDCMRRALELFDMHPDLPDHVCLMSEIIDGKVYNIFVKQARKRRQTNQASLLNDGL